MGKEIMATQPTPSEMPPREMSPRETSPREMSPRETPKGAWRITFLLFLFMLVNFADKIVVGLPACRS